MFRNNGGPIAKYPVSIEAYPQNATACKRNKSGTEAGQLIGKYGWRHAGDDFKAGKGAPAGARRGRPGSARRRRWPGAVPGPGGFRR